MSLRRLFSNIASGLLALWLLLAAVPLRAQGAEVPAFAFSLSASEGWEGDQADLALSYDGGVGEVGAFFAQIDYDPNAFEYVRVSVSQTLRGAYTSASQEEGRVRFAYTMKSREECLLSPGELFRCRFRVREGGTLGGSEFTAAVYDVVDPAAQPLNAGTEQTLSYQVLPPPSAEAYLMSLSPSQGALSPDFSPECLEYAMEVPFEVTSLTFSAETAENGTCKVNRKNLGAGGSDTQFLLTVTSEDRKNKSVYRVTVHRLEKPAPSPTASPTPKPAKTPSPAKTPKPAGVNGSPAKTSAPSLSPKPSPLRATPAPSTPEPSAVPAAAQTEKNPSGGQKGPQPLVFTYGQPSLAPMLCAFLFLCLAVLASIPVSKWLGAGVTRLQNKKRKK